MRFYLYNIMRNTIKKIYITRNLSRCGDNTRVDFPIPVVRMIVKKLLLLLLLQYLLNSCELELVFHSIFRFLYTLLVVEHSWIRINFSQYYHFFFLEWSQYFHFDNNKMKIASKSFLALCIMKFVEDLHYAYFWNSPNCFEKGKIEAIWYWNYVLFDVFYNWSYRVIQDPFHASDRHYLPLLPSSYKFCSYTAIFHSCKLCSRALCHTHWDVIFIHLCLIDRKYGSSFFFFDSISRAL